MGGEEGSLLQPITYFPNNFRIPNGGWFYGTFLHISTQIESGINYWTGIGQNRGNGGGSEKDFSGRSRCDQDSVKNYGSGRSAHYNEDKRGSAQDGGGSTQEVGDGVKRAKVDGV